MKLLKEFKELHYTFDFDIYRRISQQFADKGE